MILSRDLSTALILNLKLSDYSHEAYYLPLKGSTVPMVYSKENLYAVTAILLAYKKKVRNTEDTGLITVQQTSSIILSAIIAH